MTVPSTAEHLQQQVAALESRIVELTREMQSLTYSISHDLRAPLRSILGFTQILQQELAVSLTDEQRHYFARVQEGTDRLAVLIDGLLEIARAGTTELRPREFDVTQQTGSILHALDVPAALQAHVQPDMRVHADLQAMQTVLQHLLRNAVRACAARTDPRIDVSQHLAASATTICVADNGIGFDPRYNDKAFTPFQRLHADPSQSGRGIGLALVQRLIARHGGKVWAEGQPNIGAKFFIELPTLRE